MDPVDEKILQLLSKDEAPEPTNSGDKHFVMSLLPHFEKLDEVSKMDLQIKIMQDVREAVQKMNQPARESNQNNYPSYQALLNDSFSLQNYTNLS